MILIYIVIIIGLYLFISRNESFTNEKKKNIDYIVVTKYNDKLKETINDMSKKLNCDIYVVGADELEMEKIQKMGYKGELLDETNPLLLAQYFIKRYNRNVLYIDQDIEILSSNVNDDIKKYVNDKDIDIVLRCNSHEFLEKCENDVSDSFMLYKKDAGIVYNNKSLNSFLKDNPSIKWKVFNSYYYPNSERYYKNTRSVYYNRNPYIKNSD